eukprot:9477285-Pyramimonas_sp.AAC.2
MVRDGRQEVGGGRSPPISTYHLSAPISTYQHLSAINAYQHLSAPITTNYQLLDKALKPNA